MLIKFVLIGGRQDGATREFESLPLVVGRDLACGLCIEDRWASRRHCEFLEQGGQILVRDLASRHGTIVNGRPVEETTVAVGDRIMIGLTEVLVAQVLRAGSPVEDELALSESELTPDESITSA